MKNKFITYLMVFCPLSLFGQDVDSIIKDIRAEYNLIVKNKETYKKNVLNINLYDDPIFDEEEGRYIYIDDICREKVITYYMDEKNNQIKLISLYEANYMHKYYFKANLTEYFFKNDNLFFIYQQTKSTAAAKFFDDIEDVLTAATEKRIYTIGDVDYHWTYVPNGGSYYSINNCVRYLTKSVEGKLSDITELLQKTTNTETDCSKSTEEKISPSVKELFDIYYGRDETVKISTEPPPTYFYNILFRQ